MVKSKQISGKEEVSAAASQPPSAKIIKRLHECKKVLAELDQGKRDQFEIVTEWAKLRHLPSGHEILPDQVADFLSKSGSNVNAISAKRKKPVEDPRELSKFLSVHKSQESFLYCHLTRKQLPNDLHHAELHINGKYYRHKFYEWLRRKFAHKRKELCSSMRLTRKMIEHGKLEKLRLGDKSERNTLEKGFMKAKKLRRISRYSKLIILSFKPL